MTTDFHLIDHVRIPVASFLCMHVSQFVFLRGRRFDKSVEEMEETCLLTLKDEHDVEHPVFTSNGKMYDVYSLHNWLTIQKEEGRERFFVIQGCFIEWITMYSSSIGSELLRFGIQCSSLVHLHAPPFAATFFNLARRKRSTASDENKPENKRRDDGACQHKRGSIFKRLSIFHERHIMKTATKPRDRKTTMSSSSSSTSNQGFRGGGRGSAFEVYPSGRVATRRLWNTMR